jgi:ATP-dependent DNA ligase
MKPMLSQAMTQERLFELCANDDWVMQPKLDGRRCLFNTLTKQAWGRNGQPMAKYGPWDWWTPMLKLPPGLYDGELIMGRMFLFDTIGRPVRYQLRLNVLNALEVVPQVRVVPTAYSEVEKLTLIHKMLTEHGEGVVARDLNAYYVSGKRTSGSLKFKFTRDVDCVVLGVGARNLRLGLYDQDSMVEVGRVTKGAVVEVGDVVTVTYLCVGSKGRLREPVRPRLRFDKGPRECTLDQLS